MEAILSTFDTLQANANATMGCDPVAAFNVTSTETANLKRIEDVNFDAKNVVDAEQDGILLACSAFQTKRRPYRAMTGATK